MVPFFFFFGQIIIILVTVFALFAALQQYYYAPHSKKRILFGVITLTFYCALAVFGLIPLIIHSISFKNRSLLFTYDPWLLANGISYLTFPSIRARRSRLTTITAFSFTAFAIITLFLNWITA